MTNPVVRAVSVLGCCVAFGTPAMAPAQTANANQAIVNGIEMDLGVMPAQAVRDLPPSEKMEHVMHRGAPNDRDMYHVNVSLFDSTTHAQIRDARVEATVEVLGMGGETKGLEAMTINHFVSYGNYFEMASARPYWIIVTVRRNGAPTTTARFQYQHY